MQEGFGGKCKGHIHLERVENIFQMSGYACIHICGFKFDQSLFICFSKSFLSIALVENIPEGLNYSENAPFHLSLFQGWMNLLNMAKKSVDIVSSHWDLNHSHPSACQVSCILCACDDFSCVHFTLLCVTLLVFLPPLLNFKLIFFSLFHPQYMYVITFVRMCCC